MKIVSGAQTGTDRAALDAALALAVDAGGWCPDGRKAEDGIIPFKYPVKELPGGGYSERTKMNVLDSEGTMVIYFGQPSGGTALTLDFCKALQKPCLLVDAQQLTVDLAAKRAESFISHYAIKTLNVAGPRASEAGEAYGYTLKLMTRILQDNDCQGVMDDK